MIRNYTNEYYWLAIGPSLNKSFRIAHYPVGYYGILDVDVSVGGGIHPHIQYPRSGDCSHNKIQATLAQMSLVHLWNRL